MITLLIPFLSAAQVSEELQKKWDKESAMPENPLLSVHPTALPDRILITPLSSDNKEIRISWRTDTSVATGRLEIISGDSFSFPKDNRERIDAVCTTALHKDYPANYHTAIVKDLKPGVLYKYRVGSSPMWSEWFTYKHAEFDKKISFLYFGDAQNDIYEHTGKIFRNAYQKFDDAQLAIHIGDLINHANNDYEWGEWHAAARTLNTSMPTIATMGNHEYLKNLEGSKTRRSDYWDLTFPHISNQPGKPFFLDYGFARFIMLNSNEDIYPQGKWLDSLLNVTNKQWVILVFHHPVFSGALKRQNKGLQDNWLPVIEKYKNKIGLVLQGHDHTYARGGLSRRTGTKEKPSQPVFLVSVIGEKRYELSRQSWMDVAYPDVSTYQYIELTPDKIMYQSYSETNTLIDSFEILKK